MRVEATDLDAPNSDNSDVRYRIVSQTPQLPSDNLFVINPVSGVIRVNAGGLDREVRLLALFMPYCACFIQKASSESMLSYRQHSVQALQLMSSCHCMLCPTEIPRVRTGGPGIRHGWRGVDWNLQSNPYCNR